MGFSLHEILKNVNLPVGRFLSSEFKKISVRLVTLGNIFRDCFGRENISLMTEEIL